MKGIFKFLATFAIAAVAIVTPVKADAIDDQANWLRNLVESNIARAKTDQANQEAKFAAQRQALANELAGYAKRAEIDYNNQLALEQRQQAAWANELDRLKKRVETDQKNYNTSFLNEIYKSSVENVRIKNQLLGSIQDLTKANPSFASGVDAAKDSLACAQNDSANAKAALDASK
ncbi:MAG: hypothetical protein K6G83_16675 [Lachnospiraceae bacterium]|nr:hypothetical protein [Lachnospiraceae bacterium]